MSRGRVVDKKVTPSIDKAGARDPCWCESQAAQPPGSAGLPAGPDVNGPLADVECP